MNQIEAGTVNQNNIGNMQTDWMHIIQSLSKIYTSVYDIDVKQNRYTELASESTIHSYIGSSGKAQERLNFFCHHMMTPAYTDEMLEFVDLSTLEERLANNRIISKQYESTVMISDMNKEAPTWRQCSFIEGDRDNDGHLAHVIFATQSIQETKIRELETQKKLQETNDELKALLETERKYTTIIGSLGSIYAAMYYVDLEDRSFQELISLDSLHPVFGEKGDARALLRKLVDLLVSEEYRPIMRLFTDLDTVDDRLGDKRIIIQEYVRALGGWTRCSFIAAQKDENGRNRKVILGLREITAEKETIEIQESLIQALSMSYENVYTVNMNTYEAICYRMGQNMSDRYGKKFAIGNYEKNIQLYIENDVYQEDRHLFAPICTVDGVSNLLSDKSIYSFHYRVFRNEQIHYYQCQLVKPRKERREFVVGFRDVDDEMRRQQKQIREMETQREIIQGLGSEYYSVLLVNPDTDTVSVYRAEDEDGRAIAQHFGKHHESWTKGVRSYVKEQVSEASRGQFLEKLSLDFIRSRFQVPDTRY